MSGTPVIAFRAKVERGEFQRVVNGALVSATDRIKVPTLERRHCDMPAWRASRKYGGYANSDLFPSMLARIKRDTIGDYLYLSDLPGCATVDDSGFLASVTIAIQDAP